MDLVDVELLSQNVPANIKLRGGDNHHHERRIETRPCAGLRGARPRMAALCHGSEQYVTLARVTRCRRVVTVSNQVGVHGGVADRCA